MTSPPNQDFPARGNAAPAKECGATVLVVDDEQINRAILVRMLQQHGFRALQAGSGGEAIALVEADNIDLVLLDIVMPELDGFDVLRVLRRKASESDLPVIMVTATADRDQIMRAFQCGANDYVTKPVDVGVTMARIQTHIKLKAAQAALRLSEERYALVTRGTNDGLWDWDIPASNVYYSPRWFTMLGLKEESSDTSPEALLGRIHTEDRPRVESDLEKHLSGVAPLFETELRMRHTDGSYRWMLCRGLAVRDDSGTPLRIAGSLTDITEGKVADALTGLPNRVLFLERLRKCHENRKRDPNYTFALLYLDLDNFKLVNDSLGHDYGDRLLVSIARRLEGSLRAAESFVSRLGGDEFAVLLENIRCREQVQKVAERMLDSVSAPISLGCGREVFASVSVGVSISSDGCEDSVDMLQEADTAMYKAKAEGKSCIQIFDPEMKQKATLRLEIETELRRSVEQDNFELHYQPIVDIQSSRLVGFEALVRWNHPTLGMVSPSEFIPVAEETGLVVPIGRWVLFEACRQLAAWKESIPSFSEVTMNVNLSNRHLSQEDLQADIVKVLSETGLPACDLKLEVTESAVMENPESCAAQLARLRTQGVKVAIDDFGTGYSSLAFLHRLPLDALKIDRSFVDKMLHSEENLAIVSTILTLAESLNLDVVAEGIETEEQRQMLQSMGCLFAQGFYFSRPMKPAEVVAYDWNPAARSEVAETSLALA